MNETCKLGHGCLQQFLNDFRASAHIGVIFIQNIKIEPCEYLRTAQRKTKIKFDGKHARWQLIQNILRREIKFSKVSYRPTSNFWIAL